MLATDEKKREETGAAALALQEELFSVQRAADQVLGRAERIFQRLMKAA